MSSNISPIPIEDVFKLPIFYISKKESLKQHIIDDLELVKTNVDISESDSQLQNQNTSKSKSMSMFAHAFQPKSEFGLSMLNELVKSYSYDVTFLKETQSLLKSYSPATANTTASAIEAQSKIIDIWREIKYDTGFKEKYHYIDWSYWEFLNKSETFLQFMSMYNMASPVLSLLVPFVILIIPFFIIKAKGLPITMPEYIQVLKVVGSNHAVGKIFTQFNTVSLEQKAYLIISVGFYFFSVYQNFLTCIRFHANMKKIHDYLGKIKGYIESTIQSMDDFLKHSQSLSNYLPFNEKVRENCEFLKDFKDKLNKIRGETFSIRNFQQIGHLLKFFYQLHEDKTYNDSLLYAFGFNGYIEVVQGIQENIAKENICFASFDKPKSKKKHKKNEKGATKKENEAKEESKIVFKDAYYPALINKDPIRNTIDLQKSLIITGPNASGKTTTLKTALINIIITQQFGCGFYKEATMQPFKYVHCYLNIPDTSGRDSLFQAEARRCKEILDIVVNTNDETHFCVFDELYSGTNPDEAVISSIAFMKYLLKYNNVTSILTTHFIKVCKKLDKHKKIQNHQMEVLHDKDKDFTYTYSLKTGISTTRGGLKVLKDMNYPREIFET